MDRSWWSRYLLRQRLRVGLFYFNWQLLGTRQWRRVVVLLVKWGFTSCLGWILQSRPDHFARSFWYHFKAAIRWYGISKPMVRVFFDIDLKIIDRKGIAIHGAMQRVCLFCNETGHQGCGFKWKYVFQSQNRFGHGLGGGIIFLASRRRRIFCAKKAETSWSLSGLLR